MHGPFDVSVGGATLAALQTALGLRIIDVVPKHFSNEDIILDDGEIQPQNILWVILSHKDGRHNATTLRAELLQRGVASSLLVSKHGFSQSEAYDGDRQVQYNEITMYSFFFRWMQCAAHFLATTRRTIRCVMYLECTARCQFNHVSELLPLLNSRKRQPVKWLGYRKFHDPRPQRNRHDHPVVEGSKMIAFTRSSLSRVWNLQLKSKRYCHLDIWFSKTLGPKYIFVPEHSLTYSCKHLSVCGGSSTGPVVREREPPEDFRNAVSDQVESYVSEYCCDSCHRSYTDRMDFATSEKQDRF